MLGFDHLAYELANHLTEKKIGVDDQAHTDAFPSFRA